MAEYQRIHRNGNEKIEVCLSKADFSKGLGILGEKVAALNCSYALRQVIWTSLIEQFGANANA